MCTGDNIRTAVSVARECGMVPEFSRVYIPSFVVGDQMTAKSQLEWTDVEDDSYKLDSYGLMVGRATWDLVSAHFHYSPSYLMPTIATTRAHSAMAKRIGPLPSAVMLSAGLSTMLRSKLCSVYVTELG